MCELCIKEYCNDHILILYSVWLVCLADLFFYYILQTYKKFNINFELYFIPYFVNKQYEKHNMSIWPKFSRNIHKIYNKMADILSVFPCLKWKFSWNFHDGNMQIYKVDEGAYMSCKYSRLLLTTKSRGIQVLKYILQDHVTKCPMTLSLGQTCVWWCPMMFSLARK